MQSGAGGGRLAHILAIGHQRAEEAKKASSPAESKPESVGEALAEEWEREEIDVGKYWKSSDVDGYFILVWDDETINSEAEEARKRAIDKAGSNMEKAKAFLTGKMDGYKHVVGRKWKPVRLNLDKFGTITHEEKMALDLKRVGSTEQDQLSALEKMRSDFVGGSNYKTLAAGISSNQWHVYTTIFAPHYAIVVDSEMTPAGEHGVYTFKMQSVQKYGGMLGKMEKMYRGADSWAERVKDPPPGYPPI